MRYSQSILVFCVFMFPMSSLSHAGNVDISGIWAKNCEDSVGYRGRYLIQPNGNNNYKFLDCSFGSCKSEKSLHTNPIFSLFGHTYNALNANQIEIDGKLIEKCDDLDSPAINPTQKDIEERIVGKWRGSNQGSSGFGGSTGAYWFFKSNGEFNYLFNSSVKFRYELVGNKIIIRHYNNDQEKNNKIYTIQYISDKYAVIEIPENGKLTTYFFIRKDVKINDKWLAGKLFLKLRSGWIELQKSWFDIRPIKDYEMAHCGFYYFASNYEYSYANTQACYRKKGSYIVRIDINNIPVGYQLAYGKWSVKDNVIHTETNKVYDHMRQSIKHIGRKNNIEYQMQHTSPKSIPGTKVLKIIQAPEYLQLHALAKKTYNKLKLEKITK